MPRQALSYQFIYNKDSALCCVYGGMTKETQNVQEFHGAKLIFYEEVRVAKD